MPPMTSTMTSIVGVVHDPAGIGGKQRLDARDVALLGRRTDCHRGQLELEPSAVGDPLGVAEQEPGERGPDVAAAQQADAHSGPG